MQPNAVDLRVKKISKIGPGVQILAEDKAACRHRPLGLITPSLEDGFYDLWPGQYQVQLGDEVSMGPDEVGIVIPRSSLVRNGNFITTGLYDSGYTGPMIACLHVTCTILKLELDARVAQFLVFKAEALNQYSGQYQKTG